MTDVRGQVWYLLVDDLIGGWSIANVDKERTSALDWRNGDTEIGNFVSVEVAGHIIRLHNRELNLRKAEERRVSELEG